MDNDLFGNPLTERVSHGTRPSGHAARPGSGPKGQMCGTCGHCVRVGGHNRAYLKCALMRSYWTNGPGSDIRGKDAACREFKETKR